MEPRRYFLASWYLNVVEASDRRSRRTIRDRSEISLISPHNEAVDAVITLIHRRRISADITTANMAFASSRRVGGIDDAVFRLQEDGVR